MKKFVVAFAALCALLPPVLQAQEKISHGRFKDVRLYRPQGEARSFVMLLSGEHGWSALDASMAEALVAQGAAVAGIDTPQIFGDFDKDGGDCVFANGDMENLSHYLQGYAHLPGYRLPLLVGEGAGASFAYALLAQSPADTFAGGISLGFCDAMRLKKPLCEGEGVRYGAGKKKKRLLPAAKLAGPWVVLQGEQDQQCPVKSSQAFVVPSTESQLVTLPKIGHGNHAKHPDGWMPQFLSAYTRLAAKNSAATPPPPTSLADLPLIEVPASAGSSKLFAVLLSGDGGWAGLDKEVAAALAAKGVPVVGFDSLRYFWSERTPAGLAADLDRVLRYYGAQWKGRKALLIGYSQGADVLPFAVNRLPSASKALLQQTVLMGLGQKASFEFHVTNWVGSDDDGAPIEPEALKLKAAQTLCLYGEDEDDSLCPKLAAGHVTPEKLAGGHHFDGAYESLAELILSHAR